MKRIDTFAQYEDAENASQAHIETKDFSLFYGDFEAVDG